MTGRSLENRFVAVGDIMLGDSAICVGFGFHSRYPADATAAFAKVAPVLRSGSVVLGNLECLLTQVGRGRTRLGADQMRGDPEYARSLRSAGFTALSVANNHATQHGISAFEATVRGLEEADIACVGLRGEDEWCSKPVVQRTRGGLRVGILGYCWRPRQYESAVPPYAEGDVDAVVEDVQRLRKSTDAVAVSLHWGEEFVGVPSTSEVVAARRIIDAGASVIVGHHPHVLRPVERYGRGVICYSLGNFVTDMVWQRTLRVGGILECQLGNAAVVESRVSNVLVDDSYAPILQAVNVRPLDEPVVGVPDADYLIAVERSVRRQRLAAYGYAIRHVIHYPPTVLAELIGTTFGNKFAMLFSSKRSRLERR